jgi:hypothetical protein
MGEVEVHMESDPVEPCLQLSRDPFSFHNRDL